jgi:hypothetical protein
MALVALMMPHANAVLDDSSVVSATTVVAEMFALRDERAVRASLIPDSAGHASLLFTDRDRLVRVGLDGPADPSPYVIFAKTAASNRAALKIRADNSARLSLGLSDSDAMLELVVREKVGPYLSLQGDSGHMGLSLFSTDQGPGSAQLSLYDRNELRRLALVHGATATSLALIDVNKQLRAEFGMFPGRPPELVLFEPGSMPRLELTEDAAHAAVIKLHDPAKNQTQSIK